MTLPPPYVNPASFDIGWVDSNSHRYYLADRTNASIDVAGQAFEGILGAGDFTGTGATATASQKAACGSSGVQGPDGLLTLTVGGINQVWAGDGVDAASPTSTVKVFDLATPSSGVLGASISTKGVCRADEMAYDPADHLVVIANDVDQPPFLSFISVKPNPADDRVVGTLKFPAAIDGLEQSVWNPRDGRFFLSVPQVASSSGTWTGEVAVIDPHTMSVAAAYPVPRCSPGGLALDARAQRLVIGCSGDAITGDTVDGVTYPGNPAVTDVMDAKNGRIVSSTHRVGGSDEVWFNSATGTYDLAASNMTSNGLASGYPTPVLGVLAAPNGQWIENFPTAHSAHSVAADPASGRVFLPIPSYGITIFSGGTHGSH